MVLFWLGVAGWLLVVLIGFVLLRTTLMVVRVEHDSMSPALQHGDRVVVWRRWPARFLRKDRIVLVHSESPAIDRSLYIKRVVGLPGDTLVASPQGGFRVIRDINKLNDGYGLSDSVADDSHTRRVFPIPRGHFFVCGDNQSRSTDSRQWGPLSFQCLRGIVIRKLSRAAVR